MLYTEKVIDELAKRQIKIKSYENYANYFKGCDLEIYTWRKENNYKFDEHNEEYLKICYWNLREKYIRGQKDFTKEIWERLDKYVKDKLGENNGKK